MTLQQKPTVGDFLLILFFSSISILSFIKLVQKRSDKLEVVVLQDNKIVYKDILYLDKEIKLRNAIVEIKNNKVRIKESQCPFKVCVNTGWIQGQHQQIICVPNKIVVKLVSKKMKLSGIDSVTY
ncbi:MAG: NusG domain II-containing protein [Endomicrobia bacterium]|nr:NusG domain II-containing protein [Endomicrobiia bacterium]MDW8055731.1 NusG domain II-containing protein [Elusimicrobiota bacterium]